MASLKPWPAPGVCRASPHIAGLRKIPRSRTSLSTYGHSCPAFATIFFSSIPPAGLAPSILLSLPFPSFPFLLRQRLVLVILHILHSSFFNTLFDILWFRLGSSTSLFTTFFWIALFLIEAGSKSRLLAAELGGRSIELVLTAFFRF